MTQSHQRILDSHIHLWPSNATSSSSHGWMTPNHFLAKRHGISDYLAVASSPSPTGFIYVETDRYLPIHSPPETSTDPAQQAASLSQWAAQPLEEIRFLRRMAEDKPEPGDGFASTEEAEKMKGCVIFAPCHLSPALFSRYLEIAEETAGPCLWSKVVGFRYLLQGKGEGVVQKLLGGANEEAWVRNLGMLRRGRGGKGRAFDVGVDVNRDGYEPMQAVQRLIEKVREDEAREGLDKGKRVRFVLNHLAKHPLSPTSPQPSPQWRDSITAFASDPAIYMKFSGAFNEFVDTPSTPEDVPTLLKTLSPFFNHVLESFGPRRIMFGSDWPVCNVGGPKGEEGNWKLWREVVEAWMLEKGLSEEEKDAIWWRTGCEAYGLDE